MNRVAFGVKGKPNAVFNVKKCGMIKFDHTKRAKPYTVGFWSKKKGKKRKWVQFQAKDTANCDPM